MQSISIGRLNKLDYSAEAAYKSLATKLQLCSKETKAIAITSYGDGEGKTDVAINLARVLTDAGNNVLFVDADMRKSVLISRYKLSKASNGLSHFLSGQKDLDDVMYTTNIEGLFMLTTGLLPAEPSILLKSALFSNFIHAAREKFDYIIVDTPSQKDYVDADIIASVCDGTCIVVEPGKLSCKKLVDIKEQYEEAGCEILGVIMNKVKSDNKDN